MIISPHLSGTENRNGHHKDIMWLPKI